jgi:hypothetical protein
MVFPLKSLTYPGLIGLGLVALVALVVYGGSLNPSWGFTWRDRLHQLTGLVWLDPVLPLGEVGRQGQGTVYLQGQVDRHLSLVGQSLYQLQDSSGQIWVLSPQAPPPLGTQVTIRARLHYESILMADQEVGEHYAEELDRLATPPPQVRDKVGFPPLPQSPRGDEKMIGS